MDYSYRNQFSKKVISKKCAKERDGFQKTRCCAAALAANVYNYKAHQRVAGERAILEDVTRLEAFF